MLDYFYGGQADLFSFYRLPKVLFTDPKFRGISAESKILYGLLLDRMSLSIKSGWLDKQEPVYVLKSRLYLLATKSQRKIRHPRGNSERSELRVCVRDLI